MVTSNHIFIVWVTQGEENDKSTQVDIAIDITHFLPLILCCVLRLLGHHQSAFSASIELSFFQFLRLHFFLLLLVF